MCTPGIGDSDVPDFIGTFRRISVFISATFEGINTPTICLCTICKFAVNIERSNEIFVFAVNTRHRFAHKRSVSIREVRTAYRGPDENIRTRIGITAARSLKKIYRRPSVVRVVITINIIRACVPARINLM